MGLHGACDTSFWPLSYMRVMRSQLPRAVLCDVFSRLQNHRDVLAFQCVAKRFHRITREPFAKALRQQRFKGTCHWDGCSDIGDRICHRCQSTTGCAAHLQTVCLRCFRRICRGCTIASAPICVDCGPECEECHHPSHTMKLNQIRSPRIVYCQQCMKVECLRCAVKKIGCSTLHHPYTLISGTGQVYQFNARED